MSSFFIIWWMLAIAIPGSIFFAEWHGNKQRERERAQRKKAAA